MSKPKSTATPDTGIDTLTPVALIRTAYDGRQKEISSATALVMPPDEPSLTVQSEAAACDINNIMDKFVKTGLVPTTAIAPLFGDVTLIPDYQEAQNMRIAAEQSFAALPAKIRDRFHNDPEKMIEFISDNNNYDEAVKLGLAVPKEPPPAPPASPTPDPAPEPKKRPILGRRGSDTD